MAFGADLHWLALHGADAVGVDVKSEWIAGARSLSRHVAAEIAPVSVEIRRVNVFDIPKEEQFELIYMKDTFHHLEPRAKVVAKLASLLARAAASSLSSRMR